MDESTKQLIKWGAIAAAGYFVYQWLQNSGLWAQWFGGTASNQFNSSSALLTYCQANPNGTAIYVDPTTGASSTATCAQWLASNSQSPMAQLSPASGLAANYLQAISLMQQAAGNDAQTIQSWANLWQNGTMFDGGPTGFGVAGSVPAALVSQLVGMNGGSANSLVSAEQFVAWISQMVASSSSGPVPLAAMVTGGGGPGMQGYDFTEMYQTGDGWVN
jgi:hypothetical protein